MYAKDATTADGIDDAILIMGVEKGLRLIDSIPDAGAIIVDANNQVHISKRLQGRCRIVHPANPRDLMARRGELAKESRPLGGAPGSQRQFGYTGDHA